MGKVLIMDDDKLVCSAVENVAETMGHSAECVHTLEGGVRKMKDQEFDIVVLDVRLPDGSGLDLFPEIKELTYSPEVIIITGYGDPDGAELAIKNGAWDYIEKPVSAKSMRLTLERALKYQEKKKENATPMVLNREGIIGSSPPIKSCLDILAKAARSEANVLICGDTGTGKELFASAVHVNSPRASGNFVVVDCAALPGTLVESVLFGHHKGAFTGADKSREGLIKQADGGTLFLDEVGELPLAVQKAFLRVLQERKFRPVGGKMEVTSNFRLVAATNRDLKAMVDKGKFREDLLYRLRTIVIDLPPLRECRSDIKELVLTYTARLCDRYGIGMKGFSPDFWQVVYDYDWPGNVRELIQALEKAIITDPEDPVLFPKQLPQHIRIRVARASVSGESLDMDKIGEGLKEGDELPSLKDVRQHALDRVEKKYLKQLLSATKGDIQQACRISGLSRSRLYTLMKERNVSPPGRQ